MRRIALCYVRKSVVKTGAPDPASPEIQRRKLAAWCQAEDLEPEWHEDTTGHNSGMKTDRPAWRAAIGRLSDPDVAYLLVTDYDRATRNVKDLLTVVDECERYGVKFKALASPYDVSTGQGRTFATIISAVNEGYARDVSEWRAASIDNLRRDRGRHVGPPPFGTVRVRQGGDLVLVGDMRPQPNGTDLECLAELYRLYGKEHLSYYATARRLNDTGWRLRGKGGLLKEWNDTDVRRVVLHHWIYAGHVVVGRSDRSIDEVLPGSHAPILPPDLTQPVGIRATVFKRPDRYANLPRRYPLTGMLCCAACKAPFVARASKPPAYGALKRCPDGIKHYWVADRVEVEVRQYLAHLELPGVIEAAQAQAAGILAAQNEPDPSAERQRIDVALDRLADLYADGQIDRERYLRKKSEYEARRPELIQPQAMALPALGDAILKAPPLMLRDIVRALFERIEIGPNGLTFIPRAVHADLFGR